MGALRSGIDELAADQLSALSYDEIRNDVAEISRSIDLLTFELQRRVREIAVRGDHGVEGFANPTRWLAVTADSDSSTAARHLAAGRILSDHPDTEHRFASGDVSWWRTRALLRAARRHPEAYRRDEAMLLEFATSLSHRDFPRAIRHWINCASDVDDGPGTLPAMDRSYLHATSLHDGMVKIDGLVDQTAGEVLLTALDTATPPPMNGEATPASQRRATALAEICRQWLENGTDMRGGVRPHVSLVVDLDTLVGTGGTRCDLAFTGPVAPDAARQLLCDASLSRIITKGPTEPLDVGRAVRTVTPAIRRALIIRDGGCRFPGCDRPPAWCDAHHITHWINGGQTSLGNLVLLCRHHHTIIHQGRFRIAVTEGAIRFERVAGPGPEP